MERMTQENAPTESPPAPTSEPPLSERTDAEREVVLCAKAMVRSWTRRHKINWKNHERDLLLAVVRLEKVKRG